MLAFKNIFIKDLNELKKTGQLKFSGDTARYEDDLEFNRLIEKIAKEKWVRPKNRFFNKTTMRHHQFQSEFIKTYPMPDKQTHITLIESTIHRKSRHPSLSS